MRAAETPPALVCLFREALANFGNFFAGGRPIGIAPFVRARDSARRISLFTPKHFRYIMFMQGSRDSSIWRSLAVAFGDGLAFGVGMKLTQTAPARSGQAPAANLTPTNGRLEQIEHRLAQMEKARAAIAAPAPAIDQKVLEAVVHAVEGRLQEHAGQVERRLAEAETRMAADLEAVRGDIGQAAKARAECDSKVAADLGALRQRDQDIVSAVEAHLEELQDHFIGHLDALRREADENRAAIERAAAAAVKAASTSLIQESLAPICAEADERARELAGLRQKVEEGEGAMLDLLNGIGEVIRLVAARRGAAGGNGAGATGPAGPASPAAESPAPSPVAGPVPPDASGAAASSSDAPLPAFAQPGRSSRLWRMPLVSSMAVALSACGLLLLHYL